MGTQQSKAYKNERVSVVYQGAGKQLAHHTYRLRFAGSRSEKTTAASDYCSPREETVVGKKIELLKNGVNVEEAEAFVRKRANFEGYYREAAGQYFFDAEEGPPVDNAGAYYTWAAGLAVAGVGAFAAKAMRR